MEYTDDDLELFKKIAEGDVLKEPLPKDRARLLYKPLYKHPLENIQSRYNHEALLRRILVCPFNQQIIAAITLGDAWCLEEAYLRGAIVNTTDQCGVTPLHLAARLDRFDCCMVLVNIGVDINSTQLDGMTPLKLAMICGSKTVTKYLLELGAKENVMKISSRYTVASTVLEGDTAVRPSATSNMISEYSHIPHHHLDY